MMEERVGKAACYDKGRKGEKVDCIVIHTTGAKTAASTLSWFADPACGVSAHVLIDTDGTVYRCVADEDTAWHAGASILHGRANVNRFSLGVELVGVATQADFPVVQLNAAGVWVAEACNRHGIALNRIVGHSDIAPGRKVDPGPGFPFQKFLLGVADYWL